MTKMTSEEDAMSLGGQAEVDRRELLQESSMVHMLRSEVATMQATLYKSYKRIRELVEENQELKNKLK
jgi:hypothetical protein|tara:strand:- start:1487 stop:1690 length:204 start_codon:yes stop_codon:yes gene_type:complete